MIGRQGTPSGENSTSKGTEAKTKESKSKQRKQHKQTNKKQLTLFWKLQSVAMVSAKFEAGSSERRGSWKPKGWPVSRELNTAL